ncbi:MAG: CHAT domain-containing protein [Spirulinaceae cyanobacterium]
MKGPLKIKNHLIKIGFCTKAILISLALGSHSPSWGQSVTPAIDGTGTIVIPAGNEFQIVGGSRSLDGSNLFHSFQQFGLSSSQIANFLADPSISNILSRIVGGDASIINGLIQVSGSNANLFLMNPAGIVFGAGSQLNVGGDFTATTATGIGFSGDKWFEAFGNNTYGDLAGNPTQFAFDFANSGAIINAGNLSLAPGKDLILLGSSVINTGNINTPGGEILITSVPNSSTITISQPGQILSLEIQPPRNNHGQVLPITPLDIPALLTGAGGVDTGLTANGSVVELTFSGTTIPTDPGTTIISGDLNASGTAAGNITILGDQIGIFHSNLNASGDGGGGQILVGGDTRGQGNLPQAKRIYVSGDSLFQANTLSGTGGIGNGGKIIFWATDTTTFSGTVNTLAGNNGGSGGFVEVSGKQNLFFLGDIDTNATNGEIGTILLDPEDFQISAGAGTPFDASLLSNNALAPGYTTTEDTLQGLRGNLILEASRDIIIDPGLSLNFSGNEGSITFTADADGNQVGSFIMDLNQGITAPGRDITISGAEATVGNLNTSSSLSNGGKINITATNGNVNVASLNTSSQAPNSSGGNVNISASQGQSQLSGNINTSSNAQNAGEVSFSGDAIVVNPALTILTTGGTGGGNVTFNQTTNSGGSANTFTITTGTGNITFTGTVGNTAPLGDVFLSSGGTTNLVSLFNASSLTSNGGGTTQVGGDVTTTGIAGQSYGNNLIILGDVALTGDELNFSNAVSGTGNLLLQPYTPSQNITLGGYGDDGTGSLDLLLSEVNALENGFNSITIGRDNSSGSITLSSDVSFLDPVTWRSPLGSIDTTRATLRGEDNATITLEAGQNLITGNIINPGRAINLISNGSINTAAGTIDTSSPGNGGNVTLKAAGPITTGDINADSSGNGVGGRISFTSPEPITFIDQEEEQETPVAEDEEEAEQSSTNYSITTNNPKTLELATQEIKNVETNFSNEFADHLGLSATRTVTLQETQATLEKMEKATGVRTAIIYAFFKPQNSGEQTNQGSRSEGIWELDTLEANPFSQESLPNEEHHSPDDYLEIVAIAPNGEVIRHQVPDLTRRNILYTVEKLRRKILHMSKPSAYIGASQQLYDILLAPVEEKLQAQGVNHLAFIMDSGLRSVPMAALHDGNDFIIKKYSVSLMPSFSLTETNYRDIRKTSILAMGAEEFPNQAPLPAVPIELSTITNKLWKGKAFLNEEFTLSNLKTTRKQEKPGILHLATHANFRAGKPANSYIYLWNDKLTLDKLPTLGWSDPQIELLVLSACQTALGSREAELGFAGLAVLSGAKSVLGSLWSVDDRGTLGLMGAFYKDLKQKSAKVEALRSAQLAMLEGKVRVENDQLIFPNGSVIELPRELSKYGNIDLTHPYYWSSFTMVGNPW